MPTSKSHNLRPRHKLLNRNYIIAFITLLLLVVCILVVGYLYNSSPSSIRNPKLEHYHFRMQIIVNGKAEDFGGAKYQTEYAKDQCNGELPAQPIHFHDNKDQLTHIHWEAMTGGLVLKNYGWNLIGGPDDILGYNLQDGFPPKKVKIYGDVLPSLSKDDNFYIYIGDQNSYTEKKFADWLNQDLEVFLGKTSSFPAHKINTQSSLLDSLFPRALAHGGVDDGNDGEPGEEAEVDKLTRLNNLLGNVVIFAQPVQPTNDQIKARFNTLEPLPESTCAG